MVKIWRKEKYIRKEGFTEKWDEKHKYLKTKEETRRTLIEESEHFNFLYNLSLLKQAGGGMYAHLFYKINLFFSIFILEQSPLLLFIFLSYKFY